MDNEALIEMIAKRIEAGYIIMSNPENARRDAQAAIDALKAEGWMLVRWERRDPAKDKAHPTKEDIWNAFRNGFKLTGLEPPKGE